MKHLTITIVLLCSVLESLAQTTSNIQSTTQGSVGVYNGMDGIACSGGEINVGFRFKFTAGLDGEEMFNFYFQAPNLAAYPGEQHKCKEFFGFTKTLAGVDTIYWFKAPVIASIPLGPYMLLSSPSRYPGGKNLTVSACTGIKELSLNNQIPIYYDLRGVKIEKRYNELIIEQVGANRRKIIIQE